MAVLAAIVVATCGGCSYRIGQTQMTALKAEPVVDPAEVTGSITPVSQTMPEPAADEGPTDSDMAFARNAASDVLTRGAKDSSQPWENPKTGARGSVTPLASSYTAEGRTCRDFLASYVKGRSEAWLQGEACRAGSRWEIRAMQPWKRS
jgi:surface antigen